MTVLLSGPWSFSSASKWLQVSEFMVAVFLFGPHHVLLRPQICSLIFIIIYGMLPVNIRKPNTDSQWFGITQVMTKSFFDRLSCTVYDYGVWDRWRDPGRQASSIPLIKANRQQLPAISQDTLNKNTSSSNTNNNNTNNRQSPAGPTDCLTWLLDTQSLTCLWLSGEILDIFDPLRLLLLLELFLILFGAGSVSQKN